MFSRFFLQFVLCSSLASIGLWANYHLAKPDLTELKLAEIYSKK